MTDKNETIAKEKFHFRIVLDPVTIDGFSIGVRNGNRSTIADRVRNGNRSTARAECPTEGKSDTYRVNHCFMLHHHFIQGVEHRSTICFFITNGFDAVFKTVVADRRRS